MTQPEASEPVVVGKAAVYASVQDGDDAIREAIERELESAGTGTPRRVQLRALRRVNQIRSVFGFAPLLDLTPGRVGDTADCPIARSLRFDGYTFGIDGYTIDAHDSQAAQLIVEELNEGLSVHDASPTLIDGFEEFSEFVEQFDNREPGFEQYEADE